MHNSLIKIHTKNSDLFEVKAKYSASIVINPLGKWSGGADSDLVVV